MKKELRCGDSEVLLLLEQSGELQAGDAELLRAHLAVCSVCAAEKRRLAALVEESRAALKICGPAPVVTDRIHNAACGQKQGRFVLFRSTFAAACAAAAVVVLAVGVVLMQKRPSASGDSRETAGRQIPLQPDAAPVHVQQQVVVATARDKAHAQRIRHAHALVDYAHVESVDSNASSDLSDDTGIEALAERLLKLEGFEVADSSI